ncbi:MAG: hypothetical protein Tsb0020_11510 [Haliangiales bacterium]
MTRQTSICPLALATALAALGLSGCQFNTSGIAGNGDSPTADASPDIVDAAPPTLDASDANGACGGALLSAAVSVDGVDVALGAQAPHARVLVGDLITLSATGSCSADGTFNYSWAITPADGIASTIEPNPTEETITLYAAEVEDYQISLTLSNRDGNKVSREVTVEVRGWQRIDGLETVDNNNANINALAVGGGHLWIGTELDAHRLALPGTPNQFEVVNDLFGPDDAVIDPKQAAMFFDSASELLWIGGKDDASGPWQIDIGADPITIAQVAFDTPEAFDTVAKARSFATGPSGIAMATDEGITVALDNTTFTGVARPDGRTPHALGSGAGRRWAGSNHLYDLDNPGPLFDVLDSQNDDRIRALAVDEVAEVLWVGTADFGVASFSHDTDSTLAIHDVASGALPSDRIRAILVEPAGPHQGDVWVATDSGVARYLSRRDTWIQLGDDHGLLDRDDLEALAIDVRGDARTIYAGSNSGLVYIHEP